MEILTCDRCHNKFERYPSQVKRGGKFCSRKCQNKLLGENRQCGTCQVVYYVSKNKLNRGEGKFCSRKCKAEWQRGHTGDKNPNWRGGRCVFDEYIYIRTNGRYIGEHRLVMEKHLGRTLKPDEQVNHINGNKTDNRVENLEVLSISEHWHKHFTFKRDTT